MKPRAEVSSREKRIPNGEYGARCDDATYPFSFQECWTLSRLLLAPPWDQSQASIYASQIRHFFPQRGPRKLKFIQSHPPTAFCCPRHVLLIHPATALPLSLSFPPAPPSLLSATQRKQAPLAHSHQRSTPQIRNSRWLMDGGDVWSNLAARVPGDAAHDKTVANRIMLRFRPIAPKPVAGGSAYGGTVPNNTSKVLLSGKRAKRKYVRVRRNSGCGGRDNNRSSERSEMREGPENAVVTLQLMPEKSEPSGSSIAGSSWCKNVDLDVTVEKVEIPRNPEPARLWTTTGPLNGTRRVVESWVTVESVGDTCTNVGGLGSTDVEKVKNLETDTCPGFLSDGTGKVGWVNEAYKRMVSGNEEGGWPEEVVVRLKVKDNVIYSYEAFTCGVRLQYTWQEKWTKMVPCDVWKLDCGGFAWRLDIKAALSLGL